MILSSPLSIEIGVITAFSGAIVNIPPGWFLCDGTNNTPDLRNKFLVSAGPIFPVDDSPPVAPHVHTFTGDGHTHNLAIVPGLNTGPARKTVSTSDPATGTTNATGATPPYYALAYIMYLGE